MHRVIKLLVSAVFWALCRTQEAFLRLAGHRKKGLCTVLYYHAIPSDQCKAFALQMDDLIRYSRPVPADWRIAVPEGCLCTAVTFDDAFASVAENALPELKKREIPCTIFVPTSDLGRTPQWEMAPDDPDRLEVVLTRDRLREIASEDVKLGSHSVTHPDFDRLSIPEIESELRRSKETLEGFLAQPVTLFSFPHGSYNAKAVELAREAGYKRVFTITPNPAFSDPDEYISGRVKVSPLDWPIEFRLKLLGMYRWIPAAGVTKRRVFIFLKKVLKANPWGLKRTLGMR